MKKNGFTIIMLFVGLLLIAYASDAQEVSGMVYHDQNGNSQREAGESGLAGIPVSNGIDIVVTDTQGRYSLPLSESGGVFVIKPAGWTPPVDEDTQRARFFYLHRPEGSPTLKFGGIPPTGPLPENVDFALRPQAESSDFRIVCLGDSQARNLEEVNYLGQDLIAEIAGMDAAFGLTLGDIVFDNLSVFKPIAHCVGRARIPWHHVPGNHDMDYDAPTWQQSYESFRNVFGPDYYAFAYGKTHVFVLSSVRWDVDTREYHAELGEQQRRFIENYLALIPKDHFLLFTMHIPIMEFADRDALFALLKEYPHTLSLSAHRHRHQHFFLGEADGWTGEKPHHHIVHGTACGSWYRGRFDAIGIPEGVMDDGVPKGYSIITIHPDNTYETRYKATRRPAEYQMDIYAPEGIAKENAGDTEIVANFFNGTERCHLEMRINNGAWTPMEQFVGQAPFYAESYQRQMKFLEMIARLQGLEKIDDKALRQVEELFRPVMGRGIPDPNETNHLWRAKLSPDCIQEGYNTIEIQAHDLFGKTHRATRYFRTN